jgi:hypothetical protein
MGAAGKPRRQRFFSCNTACPLQPSGRASRCRPERGRCGAPCSWLRVGEPLLEIQLPAVPQRWRESFVAGRRPAQEHVEIDGGFLRNRCPRKPRRGDPRCGGCTRRRQRPGDFLRIEESNARSPELPVPAKQFCPPLFCWLRKHLAEGAVVACVEKLHKRLQPFGLLTEISARPN